MLRRFQAEGKNESILFNHDVVDHGNGGTKADLWMFSEVITDPQEAEPPSIFSFRSFDKLFLVRNAHFLFIYHRQYSKVSSVKFQLVDSVRTFEKR